MIWSILYRLTTVVPIDRHGSIRPEFSLHLDFVADITCILIVLVRKGIQNLLRYCSTVYFLHIKKTKKSETSSVECPGALDFRSKYLFSIGRLELLK